MIKKAIYSGLAGACLLVGLTGCSTPKVSSHNQVSPDQDIIAGGMSSGDIRTVASQMCPAVLSIPEVVANDGITRIAISPMKNSSRFIVDMNIFMKKLRLELNRYGQGQVRFFSQNNAAKTRSTVLKNRQAEQVSENLNMVAEKIISLPLVSGSAEPVSVAVIPVLNANFVNMNADSLTAMLRGKVAERSNGKILFALPGSNAKVDYYLTGQFIAEGMKQEGIVNLVDYIGLMEDRMKKGESLDLYDESPASIAGTNSGNQVNVIAGSPQSREPSLLRQIQLSSQLRTEPNVTKHLNVMLVKADDQLAVFEKMFTVEEKITDGTGAADFVLSGEVSGLSKRVNGTQSDYLLITMQLIDPVSNELLWEDGYEVKKSSVSGTVYQ
ncbi:MAG: penicillin-binding protein activator LpoB [Kiritimatiellaceae bacterium]|nr:penicillin-binding protein activator LpoB [Kiritimatiellaceae bacterium]